MTISSSVGRAQRVARGGLVVGLLATLVGSVSLTVTPAASAAPAVVNVTVECLSAPLVTADVGDTIAFTFASSCNYARGANEWNIWNFEGTGINDANAGFLSFVNTTATFIDDQTSSCGSTYVSCYLPYALTASPPFDWSVSSDTAPGIRITTVLSALNGSGLAIQPGVALGVLNNQMSGDPITSPSWSVPIIWAGPRTSSGGSEPDMTLWHQSISRSSSDAACPSGYAASWAQWPNDHKGGWVCNRELFAYQSNPGA